MQWLKTALQNIWKCRFLLPTLVILIVVVCVPDETYAQDNGIVEGEHGETRINGILTEGVCRLEMDSELQKVQLGETSRNQLMTIGDRGMPVLFQLQLRDCLRTGGNVCDSRSGTLTWSADHPVVSVTFIAPGNTENSQLVAVRGVSGIGLRIVDDAHQDIRLGEKGHPLFLTPGSPALNYWVMPERTSTLLGAGNYRASVDFRLNYD